MARVIPLNTGHAEVMSDPDKTVATLPGPRLNLRLLAGDSSDTCRTRWPALLSWDVRSSTSPQRAHKQGKTFGRSDPERATNSELEASSVP